jgi:hypothetical protein
MIENSIIMGNPDQPHHNTPNERPQLSEGLKLLEQLLPKDGLILIEPGKNHIPLFHILHNQQSEIPGFLSLQA